MLEGLILRWIFITQTFTPREFLPTTIHMISWGVLSNLVEFLSIKIVKVS